MSSLVEMIEPSGSEEQDLKKKILMYLRYFVIPPIGKGRGP